MALGGQLCCSAAASASAAAGPACSAHQPAPGVDASMEEQWVAEACRVQVDGEGYVVTHIPALLAAAVSRLVAAAASADAAQAARGGTPCVQATRLHGCRPPGISIEAYAERLLRYCKCSPVAFVAAFAYMARLQRGGLCSGDRVRGGQVRVDALTAHRLMAVGTVVATKFFDDKYYSNDHYAQVAGVSLAELNAMELDFLFRLDFRARVAAPELAAALRDMHALAAGNAPPLSSPLPMLPEPTPTTVAQAAVAAPPAGSGACGTVVAPVASACAAAGAAAEGEDSCSDATTVAALCASPAHEGCEEQGPERAAAAAALPWGDAASPAAAAEAFAAMPRRSKKRCSIEAQHLLRRGDEERQRLAEPVCQA